jgi:Protein of unknown function (DUF1501)
MLTIWNNQSCNPQSGLTRRTFLRVGAFGGLLTLADLLRLRAAESRTAEPMRAKAAIMVFLTGGPSHIDTLDLKPDAPVEIRGTFKPIRTCVPGIDICEHLPRLAVSMGKLAVVRSVTGMDDDHTDFRVMNGFTAAENKVTPRPSLGAVVSRLRSGTNTSVPPFVSLRGLTPGLEPGYLGIGHRAFAPTEQGLANLTPLRDVGADRLKDRRSLLESFDQVRRDADTRGGPAGLDAFTDRAIAMITSGAVRDALDLKKEPSRVRDRYGKASQLLLARRLVEAGAGFVTVEIKPDMGGSGTLGWDTHSHNEQHLRRILLPHLDSGVSALVEDLHARGLDRDVVVLVWGEMGRTPVINKAGGRDHWPRVMSCLLAGGGLRTAQVVGATTSRAEEPKDRACSVQTVLATVYHALGIDPARTFDDRTGRPRPLLDDTEPIKELL